MNNISETSLALLYRLADLQHPHLVGNNHTRFLINKVYQQEPMTVGEAFDCGKYYQRMLGQLDGFNDSSEEYSDYLHAILEFKWSIKS